ncbi:major facilitator superfamily domain-containing protein [Aspergillus pseudoustus]|uniref:Major facilitator superfamily domain-containing protein n=1 Tax=Aspergillus pseudoustus TaxID=1810923 RepID=A0ABR4IMY1_9EURO
MATSTEPTAYLGSLTPTSKLAATPDPEKQDTTVTTTVQNPPSKPSPADEKDDPFLITFTPDDSTDPLNWPLSKKLKFTLISCAMVFLTAFASSIFGPAAAMTASEYGVSTTVMNLSVALFVAGYAVGPLFFAPLSLIVGNTVPLLVAMVGVAVFQVPQSLATNVETIIISRFLEGMLGSGMLAVGSGMLAEVWSAETRAIAIGLSATSMNMGSSVGPIAGAFVLDRYGWRWIGWVTLLTYVGVGLLTPFTVWESSRKRILEVRAAKVRKETGDTRYYAPSEKHRLTLGTLVQRYGKMPLQMMAQEPILIVITAYLTLVYGTLYLSYQMIPYAFRLRGWSVPHASLPFLAVILGVLAAWGIVSAYTILHWRPKLKRLGSTTPEDRLPPMILGGAMLVPSLLWFGWSMRAHNAAAQIIACAPLGCALQLIFISGVVYIIDVYMPNGNSAISIHVAVRSLVSATFPLWGGLVYEKLGVEWTSTVLGGLGVLLVPSPVVFWFWGHRIRGWSRFCGGI